MEKFVLVFAGEYDFACKEEFRAELGRVALTPNLILDFSGVTYMDSSCISELIRLHKLRAEGLFEPETVVIGRENIQRIFDVLQLDRVFHITCSVGEAIGNGNQALVKSAFTVDGVGHTQPLGTPALTSQLAG